MGADAARAGHRCGHRSSCGVEILPPGVVPEPAGAGQESCWNYPRPPIAVASHEHVVVELGGEVVCDTHRAIRVLETSHPPTYYLPREDWVEGSLEPAPGSSFCEWKGTAEYFTVIGGGVRAESAAWAYPSPVASFALLAGAVAVYPAAMSRITVDGEVVRPQEGGFYGGWITSRVVGPFKGSPGSRGW